MLSTLLTGGYAAALVLATAALALPLPLSAAQEPPPAQTPAATDARIVYSSFRPAGWDIYHAAAPGQPLRRLTEGPAKKNFPTLSPRGDEVVFASDEDGTPNGAERSFEIYTMRIEPDGSAGAVRRITNHPGQNAHPRYSPDGEWVIYTSGHR
jgi:Tol biopolymer transport system component